MMSIRAMPAPSRICTPGISGESSRYGASSPVIGSTSNPEKQ